mmetsp:Transcript_7922/g.14278  ORF Transcript_7922/g.14278 Transcript_7922/m.14278 type:complete len:234 (+) Transcript_7922:2544-3245(+)
MAKAGDSTDCTKVTPAISCMISGTSLGLVMAVKIFSVMCSISLLPMTLHASRMASVAAFLICFFVSHMHAVISGTRIGRALPSCLGAVAPNDARHLRASSRICHLVSTGSLEKMVGRRDFMAKGLMLLQMAMAAVLAAAWTALDRCPACSMQAPRQCLFTAWASGAPSAKAWTRANPARASASSFDSALAARAWMFAASPDFSTPTFLTSSTREAASPRDSFAIFDSIDMVLF